MTNSQWGFTEYDLRIAEDTRFPLPPERGTEAWAAFAAMKRARSLRRKAMGFGRAEASRLVLEAAYNSAWRDAA